MAHESGDVTVKPWWRGGAQPSIKAVFDAAPKVVNTEFSHGVAAVVEQRDYGATRNAPGARSSSRHGPIAMRTNRSVGWPTAAVMRRIWRLRPSRRVISNQLSGTFLR